MRDWINPTSDNAAPVAGRVAAHDGTAAPGGIFGRVFKRKSPSLFFVHTPKCGGSLVLRAFGWRLDLAPPFCWSEMRGHLTYREYDAILHRHGQAISNDLSFSVVRNPWDWHLSFYTYVRNDTGGRRSGYPDLHEVFSRRSFRDHILGLDDLAATYPDDHILNRNVADWVTGPDGTVAVDRLLRQETLSADLSALSRALGLPLRIDPARRVNASRGGAGRSYRAQYDDAMADIIGRRHLRDRAMLGYRFD